MLVDIARDLEICTRADTRVSPDFVREIKNQKRFAGTIIVTDRGFDQAGAAHEFFHCRLFHGFDEIGRWLLWDPQQDGSSRFEAFSDTDLRECLAHFVIFYRD